MASYHLTTKIGKKGKGLAHARYIIRTGQPKKYQLAEDLVHSEHVNMPEWASHDPCLLFEMADVFERKNGSSYREIEIALPKELTADQRVQLVRDFVSAEIGERHATLWAIHNPIAKISGGEQPHAHIMYCEREIDQFDRDPEQFFKRYNPKNPVVGGCQKSTKFSGGLTTAARKEAIVDLRKRFAELQNHHLEKHGHSTRVTHLSLKDRGIDKEPEKHQGPIKSRNPQTVILLNNYRQAIQELGVDQNNASVIDITTSLANAIKQNELVERIIRPDARTKSLNEIPMLSDANKHFPDLRRGERSITYEVGSIERIDNLVKSSAPKDSQDINGRQNDTGLILDSSTYFSAQIADCSTLETKYAGLGYIDKFDVSTQPHLIGKVVEVTRLNVVLHLGRNRFTVVGVNEFTNIEYDGLLTGPDRFGLGNLIELKCRINSENTRTTIKECRPEFKALAINRDGGRGR